MSVASAAATYSLRRAQQSLGLSRSVLCGLIGAGFVSPQRGERNALRFSFRDLMLLRTAYALQQARIPPRKILQSLAQLRATLADDAPITALRITAVGSDVAVTDAAGQWSVETGQALMDFGAAPVAAGCGQADVPPAAVVRNEPGATGTCSERGATGKTGKTGTIDAADDASDAAGATGAGKAPGGATGADVAVHAANASCAAPAVAPAPSPAGAAVISAPGINDARAWFERALAAEGADVAQAERAYRQAIRLDAAFADAYINLGALLCEQRRCNEAVQLYDAAAAHCAASAHLWFNRAIALEDAGRVAEAMAAYDETLRISPDMADAHFNLGRLQERAGNARGALRHFSAYRRLQK